MEEKRELLKQTYNYYLPEELIAQTPLEKRDHSRMLCYDRKSKEIEHKHFYDIFDKLEKGDVLVLNNSKVLPARIFGTKEETGAKIEILLQKRYDLKIWKVIAKPAKRLNIGTIIKFSDKLKCKVLDKKEYGECDIEFEFEGVFESILAEIGEMPLPPYIHEKLKDKNRYQTVYAKEEGSSAAPTAGLHFTPEILQKLQNKGVVIAEVMLHVGLGTFRPVKDDNILSHHMHEEFFVLDEKTAEIINLAKQEKRRVIAVGTTSVRVLESCAVKGENRVKAQTGNTSIFIYPPYKFEIVDALITNFHLPESTLIMLVSALCGIDETLNFYKVAVEEKYRFFSFGDCCFFC